MGQRILADTNCLIDYLNNKLSATANNLLDNGEVEVSVINRIELLAWPSATSEQTQSLIDFIQHCTVHPLYEEIILKSIEIRKNYKLKLPDAIIAATTLVLDLTLISRNEIDFNKVPGLKIINPYSL